MCYAVPLTAALITQLLNNRLRSGHIRYLNSMLYGGAIFGLIDHLWNGELLIRPENLGSDLLLGIVITLGLVIGWFIIVRWPALNKPLSHFSRP
ncbi:MAG: hypothetical protein HY974_04660 [Candidatus Kerfeldbacteria bacterium]|nr:hypothetical protein [Candidatus Kerfeldbacteria bacterium]